MNELLPIIRRVRRPLLTVDVPPPVVGNVEPVQANAETLKPETLKAESAALCRDAATEAASDAEAAT
jgi:hypothetical protein